MHFFSTGEELAVCTTDVSICFLLLFRFSRLFIEFSAAFFVFNFAARFLSRSENSQRAAARGIANCAAGSGKSCAASCAATRTAEFLGQLRGLSNLLDRHHPHTRLLAARRAKAAKRPPFAPPQRFVLHTFSQARATERGFLIYSAQLQLTPSFG